MLWYMELYSFKNFSFQPHTTPTNTIISLMPRNEQFQSCHPTNSTSSQPYHYPIYAHSHFTRLDWYIFHFHFHIINYLGSFSFFFGWNNIFLSLISAYPGRARRSVLPKWLTNGITKDVFSIFWSDCVGCVRFYAWDAVMRCQCWNEETPNNTENAREWVHKCIIQIMMEMCHSVCVCFKVINKLNTIFATSLYVCMT